MARTESVLVAWTFESNEDGQWALFLRAGGESRQCSRWFTDRAQLAKAVEQSMNRAVALWADDVS